MYLYCPAISPFPSHVSLFVWPVMYAGCIDLVQVRTPDRSLLLVCICRRYFENCQGGSPSCVCGPAPTAIGLKGLLSTAVSLTIAGNIILNLKQTQIIRYGPVMTEFLNTNKMSCHHIKIQSFSLQGKPRHDSSASTTYGLVCSY